MNSPTVSMPGLLQESFLQLPDYLVICGYMLVLIGIGIVLKKRAGTDLESYFLGGRKIPGWLNACSYAATCMNSDVAPAYCGMTVITGMFICWWYFSRFGLSLMIGGILFAVFWRRLKLMTSPEFYELRFGGGPALTIRTWVSLRSSFIAVVAWTGAGLLGMHKVVYPLLGWDIWTTFAIVIPIILFYVLLSGYIGVVTSDFFQTLVIISSSIALMFIVLADFGGSGGILAGPQNLYDALLATHGPEAVSWHPPASHELLGVLGVIAWTLGSTIGYGGDAAPMAGAMEGQRILSCKNAREASKMYIWTQIILFVMLAVLTLPALGAMAKWPELSCVENKEFAYGKLLVQYMPAGLLGLAVSGILASLMSTVSSNMNFGAQTFINDVYKRSLVKNASMRHYLLVGRIVATLIVLLAVVVATSATNIIDIGVFMLGLSSAELTANWGQWWWWRFNGKARLAASFGGPAIYLFNRCVLFKYWLDFGHDTAYWVVLSSIAATTILWIVVALRTKPEAEELLIEFYKRARPMGFWGPIAQKAGLVQTRRWPILKGLGIAVMGATTVASGILAFSALYIARWDVVAVCSTMTVGLGALFFITYRAYMKELHVQRED